MLSSPVSGITNSERDREDEDQERDVEDGRPGWLAEDHEDQNSEMNAPTMNTSPWAKLMSSMIP